MTVLILSLHNLAHAGLFSGKGETGAEFLKIPAAARGAALGHAYTAGGPDVTAIEYNPAALAGLERVDVNVTHQAYFEDSSFQAVALAHPFSMRRNNLVAGAQYKQFHANDQGRDETGIKTSKLTIRDQIFQLAAAYDAGRWTAGAAGKYMKSRLASESRALMAFDAGVLLRLNEAWAAGASVLNVGSARAFVTEADRLPTTLRVGGRYRHQKLLVLADVTQTRDGLTEPAGGAEWMLTNFFALRVGLRYATALEMSAGFGFLFADQPSRPTPVVETKSSVRKKTLSDSSPSRHTQRRASGIDPSEPEVNFGLDYALRNHSVFGVTHTFTFKVLY